MATWKVLALAAIGTIAANGQLTTGTITGSVTDSSSAPVAQAPLRLVDAATGVERTAVSSETGDFAFRLLPPGTYKLSVAAPGFKTFVRAGIVVDADRSLAVSVRLEVGQVNESVTVEGGAELLEANTSSLGTVMEQRKVIDLPLNGRNPMGLANLIPTVRGVGYFGGAQLSTWRLSAVNIGGGQPLTSAMLIDGIANEKLGDSGALGNLTVEATEQFKVVTNSMSAEYGRTSGGVISVISKSGTNELHGSVFEYLRNSKMNANEFFANRVGQARPNLKYNQFGGAVGGPIRRDKLFYFANWETYLERREAQRTINSPTADQRAGNFSTTRAANGSVIVIYDPLTTTASTGGRFVRTAFPSNVIPAGRQSVIGQNILKWYPMPNLPGIAVTQAQNRFESSPVPINRHTFTGRLDYNLTPTRRVSGRYTLERLDWGFANFFNNIADTDGRHILIPRSSLSLQYTDSLSPTLLLDAKAGFNADNEHYYPPGGEFDITSLGFPASLRAAAQHGPGPNGFPSISLADETSFGRPDSVGNPGATISAGAGLTKVQNGHSLKFGGEHRVYRRNTWGTASPFGSYSFTRGFTQGPDPQTASATAGHGGASLLLGLPASGSAGWTSDNTRSLGLDALYLQDDWKASRKLMLNLGVRWESERPVRDRYDHLSNFDPGIDSPLQVPGLRLKGGLVFPGTGSLSRDLTVRSWNNVEPRIGFAYQLISRVVLRGGYGITHLPSTDTGPNNGFSTTAPMVTTVDGGLNVAPGFTLTNPYPNGIARPTGSSLGALTLVGQGVTGQIRDVHRGYSQQWNFTVQAEPWQSWMFEAAWVANHGTRLPFGTTMNFLTPENRALGQVLAQSVTNPFFGIITSGTLSTATITRQQLLSQYPQFTSVSGGVSFRGNSIYHALAVKVDKRFSRGFSLLLAYTASKHIDDGGTSGRPADNSGSGVQDWNNLRAERSKGLEDVPQRLVTTVLWEVPLGRKGSAWRRFTIGGWQVNVINTIQSGSTISLTASATGGGNRPNVMPGADARLEHPTIDKWFNTAAFSIPAPYTLGNVSRTLPNLASGSLFNLDFSLFKTFPVRERVKLDFRAEVFNLTNTPTFDVPGRSITATTFGVVTATAFYPHPREMQLALRLKF